MLLRAIAIYKIDASNASGPFIQTDHSAPKTGNFTFFSDQPLKNLETLTFPKLLMSDLEIPGILHFQYRNEHHYIKRIPDKPFFIAICSKSLLDTKEIVYLMINAEHAFERPDASRVTLQDMFGNPLGYTATDHLLSSTYQHANELKQLSIHNIELILERGEKIDSLYEETVKLTEMSSTFKRRAETTNSWCGSSC